MKQLLQHHFSQYVKALLGLLTAGAIIFLGLAQTITNL